MPIDEGPKGPPKPSALVIRGPGGGLAHRVAPRGLGKPGASGQSVATEGQKQELATFLATTGAAQRNEVVKMATAPDPAEIERLIQQKTAFISGNIALQLAILLDYTESTTDDISEFKKHSGELDTIFAKRFAGGGRQLLPIIFSGPGENAYVGDVNQLSWFNTQSNFGNGRAEPPIIAGLTALERSRFFDRTTDNPAIVKAAVVFSDDRFRKDYGYDTTMRALAERGMALASFISTTQYLDYPGRDEIYKELSTSHLDAIAPYFKEKGLVVLRGQKKGELGPIQLIAEFIDYIRQQKARALAEIDPEVRAAQASSVLGKAPQIGSPTRRAPHIPFVSHLAGKGYHDQAKLVSQGKPQDQLKLEGKK